MIVPHLSSRHLTEDDWKVITFDTGPVVLAELAMKSGFLLLLEDFGDDPGEHYGSCSDAFRAVVNHVVGQGYGYLRLSHEGNELAGFPTFDLSSIFR